MTIPHTAALVERLENLADYLAAQSWSVVLPEHAKDVRDAIAALTAPPAAALDEQAIRRDERQKVLAEQVDVEPEPHPSHCLCDYCERARWERRPGESNREYRERMWQAYRETR